MIYGGRRFRSLSLDGGIQLPGSDDTARWRLDRSTKGIFPQEHDLLKRYMCVLQNAVLPVRGDLMQLLNAFIDADSGRRSLAYLDVSHALSAQQSTLEYMSDRFIQIRNDRLSNEQAARRVPALFSRDQIAQFRLLVEEQILPIVQEIRRLQRKRLDLTEINAGDTIYFSSSQTFSPPFEQGELIAKFHSVLHELAGDDMNELTALYHNDYVCYRILSELYPVSRTWRLPSLRTLYVEPILTGLSIDPDLLFYQAGEACADLAVLLNHRRLTPHRADSYVRRLSGFAMLFLGYRCHEAAFSTMARLHGEILLSFLVCQLPLLCAFDEFGRLTVDHPELTTAERHQIWLQLQNNWLPDLSFGADGFFSEGALWLLLPQFMIDHKAAIEFAMAMISSLATRPFNSAARHGVTEICLNMLFAGGSRSSALEMVARSGFPAPYSKDAFQRAAFAICDYLRL